MGYLTFTGEIGTEVPEGYLAETVAGQQYITLQSGVILDGSITLPASAVVAGPDGNTDAGTITIITNPKTGITSVSNAASFEGGRNTETDDEFRARYYVSTDFAGGVNLDAIIAAIYESRGCHRCDRRGERHRRDQRQRLPPQFIELRVRRLKEEIAVHSPQKGSGHSDLGNVTLVVDAGNIKISVSAVPRR
ncbi:MAG: baseplate J/gp47 family protein [Gemmiger formicilis]|uniref:baseplate J/gp47 family protein n=1 Tax=Gemmiger formicilis TaxID=745368 RepID=UPI00399189C2